MEIDMTTTTQQPPVSPPELAAVKKQVATHATPPKPTSPPGAGGTGAARPRGKRRAWLLLVLAAGGTFAWAQYTGTDLGAAVVTAWNRLIGNDVPKGFAFTNGRIEATKIYITTKFQGRIDSILVKEGDTFNAGKVLARMDTRNLEAQLRQAEAQIHRAKESKAVATATVAQREAELIFFASDAERQKNLADRGTTSKTEYEHAFARWKAGEAALEAAKAQVVEAEAAIHAATADAERLRVDISDSILVAPRRGRVQYRMSEVGEVLPSGGRVLDVIDLTDVYMLFYLPEAEAGKVTIGAEARLIFDALPDAVIPATVYYVAAEAQFTPKAVETRTERQKLAFQVRARLDPALLSKYEPYVKTGLPGVIYVRTDPKAEWPERLKVKIPEVEEVKP
jgi:HlyD family secretion protein